MEPLEARARWIEWNPRRWRWGTVTAIGGGMGFIHRGPYVRGWITFR